MEEEDLHIGIVVKADGTLPFDPGVHPRVKKAILAHMAHTGHHLTPIEGSDHYRVHSGPMVAHHKHGSHGQ